MIVGIGNDIVDIRRVERIYKAYGDSFKRLFFTEKEWLFCIIKANPAMHLAKRFAAKEAFSKALGTGFGQKGVLWKDVEIYSNDLGKPQINVFNNTKVYLDQLVCHYGGRQSSSYLSLSDEFPYAIATVIISLEK